MNLFFGNKYSCYLKVMIFWFKVELRILYTRCELSRQLFFSISFVQEPLVTPQVQLESRQQLSIKIWT